ncbi:GNAT family N-acetyltransferase [Flagellimonas sp.]|uniref:GNAT family N-acetyltransferase n=1 Tax=Flagellimonas sp. TaxID=2058762 RepID=UPI003B5CE218
MNNNPFSSNTFISVWSKHFSANKPLTSFDFITDLFFVKHPFLPVYTNVGKTHTKGIDYHLSSQNTKDYKKKVCLIYDAPTYFNIEIKTDSTTLKVHRIKQYPGFLISLNDFNGFDDYFTTTFRKSSRYKLKKYKRKLELCFDIQYKMLFGDISKEEYDSVFGYFKELLEKRFAYKKVTNNNLDNKEWSFYLDVAYPMILEKKASLFVIYANSVPIGVTLNYFSDSILFDAITVFDMDYSKFHLGSVTIMKLIEWCFENNIETFDFSKGYFDYKKRWATKTYPFEYHIYYDSESMISKTIAYGIKSFYTLKQSLRDRNINEKLHKLTFWCRNLINPDDSRITYEFKSVKDEVSMESADRINIDLPENQFLKPMVFDFLYVENESFSQLKLYRLENKTKSYLLEGGTAKAVLNVLNKAT